MPSRLLNAVHSLSAVALEEFDRRGSWAADGCCSAAGWVADRTGSPKRELRARVRAGVGLRLLPGAAAAGAEMGALSPQHLAALAGCARRHPELASRDETMLVEQAQALDADAFSVAARQWVECAAAVDGPDPTTEPTPEPADEVHLSRTFQGRYQLNGSFSRGDRRTSARRPRRPRRPPTPRRPRRRPLSAGRRLPGAGRSSRRPRRAEHAPGAVGALPRPTATGSPSSSMPTTPATCRWRPATRLPSGSCSAPRVRCSTWVGSPPFGRAVSAGPSPIAMGVVCSRGCDRPPSWCDIHHCRPWSEGGATSIDNGALLCRRHHAFIHKRHWTVSVEEGKPIIRKPDGSQHIINRWDALAPADLHTDIAA